MLTNFCGGSNDDSELDHVQHYSRLVNKGICIQWTGVLDWSAGLECWTGVLDWSAGLECWTGVLDWSAGLECWTGVLDWSTGVESLEWSTGALRA